MYNYSTDYNRLFELVKAEETIYYSDRSMRIHKIGDMVQVYCKMRVRQANSLEEFIGICKLFNLRWIDPQPVAKRVFFIDEIRTWVNQLQAEEITIGKFVELLNEKALNKEANEALRSCYSIVQRKGADTNWEAIEKVLKSILDKQHRERNQSVSGKWVQVFDPSASGTGIVYEKKPFTMQDFEKGLMLAGHVEPANETEAKEKALLDAYERGQQSIIEKLKAVQRWNLGDPDDEGLSIDVRDIEAIINQNEQVR